ncbi:hypothetical protein PybrP1_002965 [[Pythium] brassicae (nom. inval.)]|nr:hypothetical protein PybrP1_002965 [[Pythium] brassicae (nom. inval.)]
MKTFALTAAASVAFAPCAAQQPAFRRLQQGGGQWLPRNGFPNTNLWPQVGNIGGGQWGPQGASEAFPQAGAVVSGPQSPGVQLPEGLEQTVAPTPAAPTSSPMVTGTPTAAGQGSAAQATIMVLLPDFLAPEHSGSGSTMVLTGESGSKDSHAPPSLPNDAAGATGKSAAGATAAMSVAAAVALGVAIANLF